MGATEEQEISPRRLVDRAIPGSVTRGSQQPRNIIMGWKEPKAKVLEPMRRHPGGRGAGRQKDMLEELDPQWLAVAKQILEPPPGVLIVAPVPILPTNPRPEALSHDCGAGFENTDDQASCEIAQFRQARVVRLFEKRLHARSNGVEEAYERVSIKVEKQPSADIPYEVPIGPRNIAHRDPEIRENDVYASVEGNGAGANLVQKFAGEMGGVQVPSLKQPVKKGIPVVHDSRSAEHVGGACALVVRAIRAEDELIQLRHKLPCEVSSDHRIEKKNGELKAGIWRDNEGENLVLELAPHQP